MIKRYKEKLPASALYVSCEPWLDNIYPKCEFTAEKSCKLISIPFQYLS